MGNITLIETFRKEEQVPVTRDRKVDKVLTFVLSCLLCNLYVLSAMLMSSIAISRRRGSCQLVEGLLAT